MDNEDRLRELIADWVPDSTETERDALVFMFLSYIDVVKDLEESKKE